MHRRALGGLLLVLSACEPQRSLSLVSVLPRACGDLQVNALRVRGLGDFAPQPAQTASLGEGGMVELALPRGARVITIEGLGPSGTSAFGRTAPVEIPALWDSGGAAPTAALAYGPPDTFCDTADLAYPRSDHQATLLDDGSVLLSGGFDRARNPVVALERYLPTGDAESSRAVFRPVLASIDARAVLGHDATRLRDGRVLISGGAPCLGGLADGIAFQGATLLAPDGQPEGAPLVLGGAPRAQHAGLLLADGRLLLTGGCSELVQGECASGRLLDSVTIYDPARDTFADGPALLAARSGHRALFRDDGLVLIVGGRGVGGVALPPELYDPTAQRGVTLSGPSGRAVGLDSSLIIALSDAGGPSARVTSWSGRDEPPGLLPQLPSDREAATITALEDGSVLLAGGWDGATLAQRSSVVSPVGPALEVSGFAARGHTATRLLDGSVLLAGGSDARGEALPAASVFLRSLVGPFETPTTFSFDGTLGLVPSRIDRVEVVAGALAIDAGAATRTPEVYALVPGAALAGPAQSGFELTVLAGRDDAAEAALLFGDPARAHFLSLSFTVGAPPRLEVVRPDRPGLPSVEAQLGCETATIGEEELPATGLAELHLRARDGAIELRRGARLLLRCDGAAAYAPSRGFVAIGARSGRVRYDNLTLTR